MGKRVFKNLIECGDVSHNGTFRPDGILQNTASVLFIVPKREGIFKFQLRQELCQWTTFPQHCMYCAGHVVRLGGICVGYFGENRF